MGPRLGRSPLLQPAVPSETEGQPVTGPLRTSFASRQDLEEYLRSEFPSAAALDSGLSPLPGGRAAALQRLAAMQPAQYGKTRNYLDGAVTRLSPYIRHGVVSLSEVWRRAGERAGASLHNIAKLASELAWRDYWQRLYHQWGAGIWRDRENYKTGHRPEDYSPDLPDDIDAGATGLVCIDSFSGELRLTGYLHNHARLWLAAYIVHWRRVRWQAGARWFLTHLLDGDPASNNLSWQWVASTFSHKPYFFNRDNLETYTAGKYCRDCRAACPFQGSYNDLARSLFRIQ
jgi:deoxyribodipyrimidine photo-lyase